jgi:hypothetical protein
MTIAPVTCTVEVPLPLAEAYALFTHRIHTWWPLATNSLGLRNAVSCVLEPRTGGRIFERTAEGLESTWGTVTGCREPEQLGFTWHPGRHASTAQEVTVRFSATPVGTLVALEHRGWEKAGERGTYLRARYAEGWPAVLAQYRSKASGKAPASDQATPFHG